MTQSKKPQRVHTDGDTFSEDLCGDEPELDISTREQVEFNAMMAGIDGLTAPVEAETEEKLEQPVSDASFANLSRAPKDPREVENLPTRAPLAAMAAWRERHRAHLVKQAAFRKLVKPDVRPSRGPIYPTPSVHPTSYGSIFGVSYRTVARRRKAGVAPDDIFNPTRCLEHDGCRYSATQFAYEFSISKRVVLAGIKAGKTPEEILVSRRQRGRPSRTN